MRSMMLGMVLLGSACATTGGAPTVGAVREIEMAHDDGRPAERPILPASSFELLIKNEPNMPSFRPVRLRFMVAQPGRIQFQLYDTNEEGRPGRLLYRIERDYGPALTSNGTDGKWVIETLPPLPPMRGPVWVGVAVPEAGGEARLWAAKNDSGRVFQRDVEPQTALISSPVPYTPLVRLVVQPDR
ncbi:MAG: hypothetical protein RMK29_05015 [Myxococcales bacterium]|nr:hypothetical protein [Myxococcota bacterium]MDW8281051.1 hypothetical protein [Myxococcales bacterium]